MGINLRAEQRPGGGTPAGSRGWDKTESPVSVSAVGDAGGHLGSRCFTRVPGNSGGGCLSAMRCLGTQQCGTHGRHVGREDWRRGPAFRKLWPGACPFPIAYHTWVDVWRRPSEVGALVSTWNLAS